jgi:hypothetical protein
MLQACRGKNVAEIFVCIFPEAFSRKWLSCNYFQYLKCTEAQKRHSILLYYLVAVLWPFHLETNIFYFRFEMKACVCASCVCFISLLCRKSNIKSYTKRNQMLAYNKHFHFLFSFVSAIPALQNGTLWVTCQLNWLKGEP